MNNLYEGKVIDANKIFDDYFLDVNALYLFCFNTLPSVANFSGIDDGRAIQLFREKFAALIKHEYKQRWYKQQQKVFQSGITVLVLSNNCIVQFGSGYCDILHASDQMAFLAEIEAMAVKFKERQKREPLEINLIVGGGGDLDLKAMEIKRTKLNLDLFYEDDFKEVDELIRSRLNKKNDKGIVLLHGVPGTGKTTYLRYLIGKLKKRVLFLSPNVVSNLMGPGFMDLLIDNPNTIVIIEDAENVIMDRSSNQSSAVSNLLNISDGLMADFLNVQLICTFNSPLTMVDSALMRKGRLIARYEFGKLSIEKAQRLSNHLGFDRVINTPMTVAEISNQHEPEFEKKQVQVLGFRSQRTLHTA